MTQKSTVLVFTTAYRPLVGGSEIALEEIIRRLPNIFFDILTPKYKPELEKTENFENGRIHRVGFGSPIDKLFFPVFGFITALKFRPKSIHAYQASFGAGAAVIYKTFFPKTRFILTLQEGKKLERQNFFIRHFRNLIIRKADVITTISHYLANYAKKINPKVELHIIPNGVDLQQFSISNNRAKPSSGLYGHFQLPIEEKSWKTIITVSRLVPKNGIGDLIEAVGKMVNGKLMENIKLLIIGDGPLKEGLKLKAKNLRIEKNIEFLEEISHELLPKYLSMADVFVRPSLSEGLGTAFLEAMAVGLPVIGTAVGGIPDFLKDGQTGLFCKVGDPQDLAEKIKILLTDKELRTRLIDNSRKLVTEKYDWNKIAARFGEIYNQL